MSNFFNKFCCLVFQGVLRSSKNNFKLQINHILRYPFAFCMMTSQIGQWRNNMDGEISQISWNFEIGQFSQVKLLFWAWASSRWWLGHVAPMKLCVYHDLMTDGYKFIQLCPVSPPAFCNRFEMIYGLLSTSLAAVQCNAI